MSLEKQVADVLIKEWASGKGGLSDTKFMRLAKRIEKQGFSIEDIIAEFDRQIDAIIAKLGRK